jgi:hypothetical protein
MHSKIHLYNKHAIGPAHKASTQINYPIARINSSKSHSFQEIKVLSHYRAVHLNSEFNYNSLSNFLDISFNCSIICLVHYLKITALFELYTKL